VSRALAIASRELKAYLLTPGGYIIIALFLVLVGIYFSVRSFDLGQPSSLRAVFEVGTWLLLFVCPAITMRAISEERRLGTFEALMTAPVSEAEVVAGKYLAALAFLALMLAPTALHVAALELYGRPDYGELLSGYLGMLLAGSAYLASGVLASVLTTSQVVAFLLTLFFWLTFNAGTRILPQHVPQFWADIVQSLDAQQRLGLFAIGLIDTAGIVYFLSLTAVFLIAAVAALLWRKMP
jgi:ABC-2 type transport system permease protein